MKWWPAKAADNDGDDRRARSGSLHRFNGGVKPPSEKAQSVTEPIGIPPLPTRLIVPLHQSIGGTPRPVVKAGDRVLKGQLIGEADGWISAAIHAPTSGLVREIGLFAQPHPSGLAAASVLIEPDGKDEWIERVPVDHGTLSPDEIREFIRQSGIVGLGGAVFPTHGKLVPPRGRSMDEVVINGGECEPYITCDDILMRERAEDIVRGAGIFRDLLQPKRVLIGIEDNKPEAAAIMRAAVQAVGENFEVMVVPALYPAGSAKQLIRVMTGKEIPVGKRSTELGVQCFNVGTAYSVWRALAHGEPLISRIVTVTGNVERPRNWDALIGTPMDELLALSEPKAGTNSIIMGGPMMGFVVPDHGASVIKATNCLIAGSPELFPAPPPEMPCIRCGECAKACPQDLQPFELYWHSRAKNFGKTQQYSIFDCIECGCCSYVCPSHIPLVQYFRFSKSEIWARERDKKAADGARVRFELKQSREDREKREKAEKLAKAAAAQAAKKAADSDASPVPSRGEPGPEADADAAKKAAIAAAMERARIQRATAKPQNTEALTPAQQQEIEAIEARRAASGQAEASESGKTES
ncbi:MAG: electron transport complex subunit RsxC [Betaproteobacteria bacterium]